MIRTGRAAGNRRISEQVAAVCTLARVRGHRHLLQPLGQYPSVKRGAVAYGAKRRIA